MKLSKLLFTGFAILLLGGCRKDYETRYQHPVGSLAPRELFMEFLKDEPAAEQKYVGKIVEIKGTVLEKGVDSMDRPYLLFEGHAPEGQVQCFFGDKEVEQAKATPAGQAVTLRGVCHQRVVHVTLDECKFIK